ncbi:MAG: hypothetical protein OXB88_00950 [Bacteriovoracales bacterium]|nr:hypothetical protein [Bacteriovoracales bacterium]
MKALLVIFNLCLFSFSSVSFADDSKLLSDYEKLTPFHENLEVLMPTKVCEGPDCSIVGQYEDNTKAMDDLLKKTERALGDRVDSAQFLATPLGKQYGALKKFMQIHRSFQSCRGGAAFWTGKDLGNTLDRISANVSEDDVASCDSDCAQKNTPSVGDLSAFSKVPEAQLEEHLLRNFIAGSLRARAIFAKELRHPDKETVTSLCRGQKKTKLPLGITYRKEKNICSDDDKKLLGDLKKQIDASSVAPLSTRQVMSDLNQHIGELNGILGQYNEQKKSIENKWKEEDKDRKTAHETPQELGRRHGARKKELLDLKKAVLDKYYAKFSQLGARTNGLFQMDTIKKASGMEALEELAPKWLGFGGFIEGSLKSVDDFAPLSPINDRKVLAKAKDEYFSKTKEQIQDLIRRRNDRTVHANRDNIAHLMASSPALVGQTLAENPDYADTVCRVGQNMAKRRRGLKVAKGASYIVAIGGGVGVGVATAGAGLPLAAHLGIGFATGLGFAGIDYGWNKSAHVENRKIKEAMLNAYLADLGDDKSIEEIRETWKKATEGAYWSSGLAVLGFLATDVALAPVGVAKKGGQVAARAVASRRAARNPKAIEKVTPTQKAREKLLQRILMNQQKAKAFEKLSERYPDYRVKQLFNFIASVPPETQAILLSSLPKVSRNFSRLPRLKAVKGALSKDELRELKRIMRKPTINAVFDDTDRALAVTGRFQSETRRVLQTGKPSPHSNQVISGLNPIEYSAMFLGRGKAAENTLGRSLNRPQRAAVEKAHKVGAKEVGKNGKEAGIGNYTQAQLQQKARILREAGFNQKEVRQLMEAGVVGRAKTGELVQLLDEVSEPELIRKVVDTLKTRLSEAPNREAFLQGLEEIGKGKTFWKAHILEPKHIERFYSLQSNRRPTPEQSLRLLQSFKKMVGESFSTIPTGAEGRAAYKEILDNVASDVFLTKSSDDSLALIKGVREVAGSQGVEYMLDTSGIRRFFATRPNTRQKSQFATATKSTKHHDNVLVYLEGAKILPQPQTADELLNWAKAAQKSKGREWVAKQLTPLVVEDFLKKNPGGDKIFELLQWFKGSDTTAVGKARIEQVVDLLQSHLFLTKSPDEFLGSLKGVVKLGARENAIELLSPGKIDNFFANAPTAKQTAELLELLGEPIGARLRLNQRTLSGLENDVLDSLMGKIRVQTVRAEDPKDFLTLIEGAQKVLKNHNLPPNHRLRPTLEDLDNFFSMGPTLDQKRRLLGLFNNPEMKKQIEKRIAKTLTNGETVTDAVRRLAGQKASPIENVFDEFLKNTQGQNGASRVGMAQTTLERILTPGQREAVEKAHLVGTGEVGKNGKTAGLGNYTKEQLLRKTRILREAGFGPKEVRKLMEKGVVGEASDIHLIELIENGVASKKSNVDIVAGILEERISGPTSSERLTDISLELAIAARRANHSEKILTATPTGPVWRELDKPGSKKSLQSLQSVAKRINPLIKNKLAHRMSLVTSPDEYLDAAKGVRQMGGKDLLIEKLSDDQIRRFFEMPHSPTPKQVFELLEILRGTPFEGALGRTLQEIEKRMTGAPNPDEILDLIRSVHVVLGESGMKRILKDETIKNFFRKIPTAGQKDELVSLALGTEHETLVQMYTKSRVPFPKDSPKGTLAMARKMVNGSEPEKLVEQFNPIQLDAFFSKRVRPTEKQITELFTLLAKSANAPSGTSTGWIKSSRYLRVIANDISKRMMATTSSAQFLSLAKAMKNGMGDTLLRKTLRLSRLKHFFYTNDASVDEAAELMRLVDDIEIKAEVAKMIKEKFPPSDLTPFEEWLAL